jgi:PleD family two-component response regulator
MSENWILLLDPFENVLNIYKMVLEAESYRVDTALDLNEALQYLSYKRYSVIITEYIAPYDVVAQWIQSIKNKAPEIYIIMNTSTEIDDLSYERLFTLGLDDYLLKPYAPGKLLVHVKKAIRQREIILENKEKEKQSLVDPLAYKDQQVIFNQTFFKTVVRQELKKAKRHQQPLSLLLLKIPPKEKMGNHYENFYRNLMKILKDAVREEDLLGRENGHLGILLNQTDQIGSRILGERLSKLIQSHPSLETDVSMDPVIKSLSFQNYTFSSHGETQSEFLNRLLEEIDNPSRAN